MFHESEIFLGFSVVHVVAYMRDDSVAFGVGSEQMSMACRFTVTKTGDMLT